MRSEELGVGREGRRAGGVSPLFSVRCAMSGFVAISLLLAPLFAHGCHGDDVDHEPLLVPLRLNPEEP